MPYWIWTIFSLIWLTAAAFANSTIGTFSFVTIAVVCMGVSSILYELQKGRT